MSRSPPSLAYQLYLEPTRYLGGSINFGDIQQDCLLGGETAVVQATSCFCSLFFKVCFVLGTRLDLQAGLSVFTVLGWLDRSRDWPGDSIVDCR